MGHVIGAWRSSSTLALLTGILVRWLALFALVLLNSACTHQKPDLNLSPTPYTSVVRIGLITDERAEGSTNIVGHLSITQNSTIVVRDKANGKIFSFPIRANVIRLPLGQGAFQILGIEFSRGYKADSQNSMAGIFLGSRTYDQSVEGRAEFEVQKADLGNEVDFGTYNPVTGEVTGTRLKAL